MGKIIAKLNLNKTPQLVENNSLVMAKNIRLLKDGTIGPDTSFDEVKQAPVVAHTITNTTPASITHIIHTFISIHSFTHFDARYKLDEYETYDNVEYEGYEYSDSIQINTYFSNYYNNITKQFASGGFKLTKDNNYLKPSRIQNVVFTFLIHEDAFTGKSTFEILRTNSIPSAYYAFCKPSEIGTRVVIEDENYIVVNPVEFYETVENVPSRAADSQTTITVYDPTRYIGQIVGLDNKIYFFYEATEEEFEFYGLDYPSTEDEKIRIFEYDEISHTFIMVMCGWKYSGGKIDGMVTTNHTGEKILTICEYFDDVNTSVKVPIKHINLSHCKITDDETIYTQNPNIPFTNLTLAGYYTCIIPNGVYQFFVRYRVRDDFYTNWFPASGELFAGVSTIDDTIQGSLKYINTHRDCPRSFRLKVEHLFDEFEKNFEDFQIGFIISNGDSVVARSWKSFNFDAQVIDFDYDKNAIKEIDIDEILETNYELFNVGNLAQYKNKLYISNYEETNFNPNFKKLAEKVNISLETHRLDFTEESYLLNGGHLSEQGDLGFFDYWNDTKISDIYSSLFDFDITAKTVSEKDYYNDGNNHNKNVLAVQAFWKNSNNIDGNNHFKYDVYWLRKTDVNLQFQKDNNIYASFTSFDNTTDDQPGDSGYVSDGGYDGINSRWWKNKLNHPASQDIPELCMKWCWIGGYQSGGFEPHFLSYQGVVFKYGMYNSIHNAHSVWKELYLNKVREKYPRLVLNHLWVTTSSGTPTSVDLLNYGNPFQGNNNSMIHGEPIELNVENITDSYLQDIIKEKIKSYVTGVNVITSNNKAYLVVNIGGTNYSIDKVSAKFILLDYKYQLPDYQGTDGTQVTNTFYIKADCTEETIQLNTTADVVADNLNNFVEYKTLMPFTHYEFYIHYVKQNGITTNGYYIADKWIDWNDTSTYTYEENVVDVIYPTFTNITVPEGYVGYFISIYKAKNEVAKIFNVKTYSELGKPQMIDIGDGTAKDAVYGDCIEVDAMLYPLSKGFDIWRYYGGADYLQRLTAAGEYLSSGNNTPLAEFGNCGEIRWVAHGAGTHGFVADPGNSYWLLFETDRSNNENKELIKITPFIKAEVTTYEEMNLNLPGYVVSVAKLDHSVADGKYVSGTDVYNKSFASQNSIDCIKLDEEDGYVPHVGSNIFYFASNFNLNYLSLSEDIQNQIRSFQSDPDDPDSDLNRQLLKSVNTLTCSSILKLETMYYDYIRKTYSVYNDKQHYKFDNTIRSSDANTDETYKNIYKFRAEDYYNIPVNRGIITKLFNLVNFIYVHTEHSLFKFTGSNNLTATEGDVALKEGDVFDSGVTELFDSQNGYAGLKKKEQAIVMFDSYVFWDDYVQQVYAFGGEGKIISISDPITKIIKQYAPNDVQFLADEVNDRFFINFRCSEGNICISYNFKVNHIISVHDFDFTFGFNSRLHTYLTYVDSSDNSEIGWTVYTFKDFVNIFGLPYIAAYRNAFTQSVININDRIYLPKPLWGQAESCVDVITNLNYEVVKNLEYINWICSEIIEYGGDNTYVAEEQLNRKYAGHKLKIYTDECSTDLITVVDSNGNALESNEQDLTNRSSWQYPRYNCGIWSINYFRDVRNKTDIFNYTAPKNNIMGGENSSEIVDLTEHTLRKQLTQENSLIYGKYIVFRMLFRNRNFKLENVEFKLHNYEKVK